MRTWIISLWLCSALCSTMIDSAGAWASESRNTAQVRAIRRTEASVVDIDTERTARDRDAEAGGSRKVNGMGTGIIIDPRGYIVTNQHVIAETTSQRVTLHDGSTYAARIISYDRKHDLAIIKIEPSRPLPVIPLGTSSDVMKGETVLAIGNPFGYEHSVTMGIVSALLRDVEVNEHQSYKNLLQTDASINPGNSGGPLLNLDGEVIGINVAIRAGAQRIGFAIPIDDARKYIANLLDIRQLEPYAFHGLMAHDVKSPEHRKLVVDASEPNSPAAAAGFLPGDVVVQVGPMPVVDRADFERSLIGYNPGVPVEVVVNRGQETVKLTLQLAKAQGPQVAGTAKTNAPVVRPRVVNEDALNARSWRVLGLRLEKAHPSLIEPHRARYRGGMKVLDVRDDSPAAKHGIRKGDVLVGLHIWETAKPEDISYVLNQNKLVAGEEPLKFYVVRGPDVLYGSLKFASQKSETHR
ncbi:MAG TPA: trypsin-like peptidase domain-containing protein [Planctomycetaceae bacterium]|nr:trypsin-like peptidase domain-containing protein [Planctomycetaceae bacterium]